MILEYIELNNFRCFEGKEHFKFNNINLIKGNNGTGKSTLVLDSLLFALYGYSEKSLIELPTRDKATSCSVKVKMINDKDNYTITREYPTKITIIKNDEEMPIVTNKEKQNFLNTLFKNVDYFKKFRMIDNATGINILESNRSEITRSLFSFHENIINKIRMNLLKEKRHKEIFNKDNLHVDTHYPSEERLSLLELGVDIIKKEERELDLESIKLKNKYYNHSYKIKVQLNTKKKDETTKIDNLMIEDICPSCEQIIEHQYKKTIIEKHHNIINSINEQLKEIEVNLIKDEKALKDNEKELNKRRERKQNLIILREKLNNRLKQKEYVYTTKDAILIKEAINYLDNFISFYMKEWLKHIEPIINSIITNIGFTISFIINDKKEFEFILTREDKQYKYKDLSNGEKLILSIAFQLSLLLEKNETGLIIADEGFSSLDEDNLNLVFDLFKNLPFQLLCIIHRIDDISINVNVINLNKGV